MPKVVKNNKCSYLHFSEHFRDNIWLKVDNESKISTDKQLHHKVYLVAIVEHSIIREMDHWSK